MNPTPPPAFQFKHLLWAADNLRSQLQTALDESAEATVQALASELPRSISFDADRPALTIAFVGQYNAGKSTLIKALTQRDEIIIDSDVCTDDATAYDWQGIRLIDTPGVRAGFVEHDHLTEDQITKSDLLIFMITAELFGEIIGSYFRDLAFTKRRASELMLVVNKMDHDPGTPEVKRADIEVVTSPLRMEDFRTVFVSAEFYLEAVAEKDAEMHALLTERSGMRTLIDVLNEFVREKGFLGTLTTPLFTLRTLASQAAGLCSSDQPEERAALELLGRRARILRDSRSRLHAQIHGHLNRALTDLSAIGDGAADSIDPGKNKEEIEEAMSCSELQAKDRVERLRNEVTAAINAEKASLEAELVRLKDSPLATQLRSVTERSQSSDRSAGADVEGRWEGVKPSSEGTGTEFATRMRKLSEVVNSIGDWTVRFAKGTRPVSGWGPSAAAGSQAHKLIYNVGKLFGASFKPWQAARIASNLGKVGRVLGPLGAILQVFGQVAEEKMEDRERVKLQDARSETRSLYWDSANEVKNQFAAQFAAFLEDFYDPVLSETVELMEAMHGARSQRGSEEIRFQKIAASALGLIEEMQHSASAAAT